MSVELGSNLFFLTGLKRPRVVGAEGVYVFTDDGRRFLDGSSGPVAVNIGYSNPRVLEAMREQMASSTFAYRLHFANDTTEALAAEIAAVMPGDLDRVFFVSGGSEAVESAVKLARQHAVVTGQPSRHKVISLNPSYHGGTLGSLSLTGHDQRTDPYKPLLVDHPKIPAPRAYLEMGEPPQAGFAEMFAQQLADEIEHQGPDTVLAFIFEPVGGAATGANVAPDGWLSAVRRICDRHGVLLIADEVMSGLARTGAYLACDHWEVVPDIVAVSKGLGAGYVPLGAMITSQSILDPVTQSGGFVHGHTYAGNPLACGAGRAVLAEVVERGLCSAAVERGQQLMSALEAIRRDYRFVGDVRGKGLLTGVELVSDRDTMQVLPAGLNANFVLAEMCYERGLILYPGRTRGGHEGDHLLVAPPLVVTADEIDELISIFRLALDNFSGWLDKELS